MIWCNLASEKMYTSHLLQSVFSPTYWLQLRRRSLPETWWMCMCKISQQISILKAFIPRLLNVYSSLMHSPLKTSNVFGLYAVEQLVTCTNGSPVVPSIASCPLYPTSYAHLPAGIFSWAVICTWVWIV